ncbi:MAG: helix-turn-helix transcriptional regulator [Alphaproteobacteria bacterium]|nr:helix-turn-helix transcriptional regulator [Alphaproteobacteria bacterium]
MRLDIFRALVSGGAMAAGELAARLGVGPSTLSFHLKDLRHAGLVTSRKDGRRVIYVIDFDAFNTMLAFLIDECCGGRPGLCLDAFKPVKTCA